MTVVDALLLAALVIASVAGIWWGKRIQDRQRDVEAKWETFTERRKELYAGLADPKNIEAEMEMRATIRDAHLYEARQTLPHPDAGPPAKVYRPPLRGAKTGSWRPRNPTD